MCMAVPMTVVAVDGLSALCQARGATRRVSLWLLQHELPVVGDHVLVHLGQALHKVSADEAEATWALLDELLAAASEPASGLIPVGA